MLGVAQELADEDIAASLPAQLTRNPLSNRLMS